MNVFTNQEKSRLFQDENQAVFLLAQIANRHFTERRIREKNIRALGGLAAGGSIILDTETKRQYYDELFQETTGIIDLLLPNQEQ